MDVLTKRAGRALRAFHSETEAQTAQAANLLEKLRRTAGLRDLRVYASLDAHELATMAATVLARMRSSEVAVFDPYITSRFTPTENEFTSTLAALLHPLREHGLGTTALLGLLKASAAAAPCELLATRSRRMLTAVQAGQADKIFVRQNFRHSLGMPDVLVWRTCEPRLLIMLENKVRGGFETTGPGGLQTNRYAKMLRQELERRGLIEEEGLAIFLTPQGKAATSGDFIPLSCRELSAHIIAELDGMSVVAAGDRARTVCLVRAYMLTYAWLNGG